MVRHAQPGSAIFAELSPQPPDANVIELLRLIEFGIRRLEWMQSEDGSKGRNRPEPLTLPWDPPPEGSIRGDVLDWDEAAAFFGWEDEMAAYFNQS